MAGEFSFSIALSLGILGLGLLANGMQTGKYRSWAAIVLALSVVSHGIVALYMAVGAAVIVLVNTDGWRRFKYGLSVGVGVVLLSAFWIGPFLSNHDYMTDMKYGARPEGPDDSFYDMFFPLTAPLDFLVTGLAIIGFVACVARRHANGTALGIIGLLTVAGVYATQDSLPIIGLLWNPRLLPLLYFVRYLLMMIGIVEVAGFLVNAWRNRPVRETPGWLAGSVTVGVVGLSVLVVLGFMFEVLPGDGRRQFHDKVVYAWGPLRKTPDGADAQGDGWSRYNFAGYEGRAQYPEYYDVVETMDELGETNGCGRVTWENNEENGQYGTTMALMLLPHWTDGCMSSMEGLFFEASGTTPYHFLTTAAMSKQSSNPVRELRYVNNDASVGVPTCRTSVCDTRWSAPPRPSGRPPPSRSSSWSPAAAVGDLRGGRLGDRRAARCAARRRQPPGWRPARAQPGARHQLVPAAAGVGGDPRRRWSGGLAAHRRRRRRDTARARPDPHRRGRRHTGQAGRHRRPGAARRGRGAATRRGHRRADGGAGAVVPRRRGRRAGPRQGQLLPELAVDGAEGPYRIAPNLMVVVPTETEVRLHYEASRSDLFFYLLTIVGIGLLIVSACAAT